MILDDRVEFADAVVTTANVNTETILGDVIDIGSASRMIGDGEPLYLVFSVDTTHAATGGASNVTFRLYTHSTTSILSGTKLYDSGAIAKGTLVAGYNWAVALPIDSRWLRYVGVAYISDTNAITTGKMNAFLVKDVAKWQAYADGLTKLTPADVT